MKTKNPNSPVVSVVMATYKRFNELCLALKSLGEQDYDDFEIVLVDDNVNKEWNDKVLFAYNDFKVDFPNIPITLIVNESSKGSAGSRNIGIESSKGKYVTFLDDDDIYLPQKISTQLKVMEDNDADFGITDLALYNEYDKLVDYRSRSFVINTDKDSLLKYHLLKNLTGTDTFMFKKEYLTLIGGFTKIDVGDEYYLMNKAIENGGKFCVQNECYVSAYVHSKDGLSSGKGKILGENALHNYKKQYFSILTKAERKTLISRHYLVLAYAYLRSKHFIKFFVNTVKSFFASPLSFFKILKSR